MSVLSSSYLGVVHCPVVVDGVVDGHVPLEGDGHRHEDGPGEGDPLQRVLPVREQGNLARE